MVRQLDKLEPQSKAMVQELITGLFGSWLELLPLPELDKSVFCHNIGVTLIKIGKNGKGTSENERKVVNAALLGLGTVGTGVYKVIKSQEQEMTAKLGCQVKITKILVRNLEKASGKVDDPSVLTTDWADIEEDPSIDIVIELIGGIEPARTYILAALKAGKNVVTANKDLIAVHGKEILETARAAQKDFLFEAAVAGGIPIISPLKNSLEANHVTEVWES